jgi:hypothetical protein
MHRSLLTFWFAKPLDRLSGDVGVFSSAAQSPSGLLVVAYTRLVNSSGLSELRLLLCSQPDCSSYEVRVLSSGAAQGYHPSLSFQSNGFPMISCSQSNAGVSLFLCSDRLCTSFTIAAIMPGGASAPGWTSVALVGGLPAVAFAANSGSSSSAVYYWRDGSSVKVYEDTSGINRIQWGSDRNLASVNQTVAMAFYVDGTGLVLVLCPVDLMCEQLKPFSVIDAARFSTDLGLYASVGLQRTSGFAVVAYHDATNLQLKLALCQNALCTTRLIRSFPSTVGWDPSVSFDQISGLPAIAFSNPANSNLAVLACSSQNCSSVFVSSILPNLPAGEHRRFETVKLVSTRPIMVVAHETLSATLVFVAPADSNSECSSLVTQNCSSIVSVVITSPAVSPFSTASSIVTVRGFVTPIQDVTQVVLNSVVNATFSRASGTFSGSVQLSSGLNTISVVALNGTRSVGAASVLVFFDSFGPSVNISAPGNNSQTVAGAILVEGFASSASGIQSVVIFNAATGVSVQTNTTTPQWSALISLATNASNPITATAFDTLGQSVSQTIVVIQIGLLPQLTCPRDFSVQCGAIIPSPALRVLNCQDPAVLSESSIPTCGSSAKSITRVSSACGVSCTYKVLLVDNTPPTISCPGNLTVACGSALPEAVALDLCSGSNVSLQVTPIQFSCGSNFSRTFTASDGCGNSASCTHMVAVSFPSTAATVTTTPGSSLTDAAIGGLIVGLILLLLILLLSFLIACCWLRKKRRESSTISSAPIMMADFDDEMSSTSVSSVTTSKLYRQPPNQSEESTDLQELMRN